MSDDRFRRLEEEKALPDAVREAVSHLNRFSHLEIGQLRPPEAAKPAPAPPRAEPAAAPPPALEPPKVLCLHCGQPNERERETCWACFRLIAMKAAGDARRPDDVTLVLDGLTYRSSDPDLPDDVKALMTRVMKEGYSQQLLRDWRATRSSPPKAEPAQDENRGKDAASGVEVFKGQRVSVIRLDGKVYTSDDPGLTPEFKQLFDYVERSGVTPALMEYLRRFGGKVKFRPATTAEPTDGDMAFWKQVMGSRGAGAPPIVPPEATTTGGTDGLTVRRLGFRLLAAVVVLGVLGYLYQQAGGAGPHILEYGIYALLAVVLGIGRRRRSRWWGRGPHDEDERWWR